ncbi:MAG: VIT domain-containing protein [Verrucomicrobiae bacterium]|nr:VIT domain-containing protein [Verrucomicrobiae bacterium]
MKRLFFLCLGLLGCAAHLSADGFIIIDRPHPPIRPHPMPMPPARHEFAPLEVSHHHVNVRIRNQFATTEVDQEFYNPNPAQLEGTYLFPIPKGAQINKFTMNINGKPVEAELLAADKARKIYEDIVRTMKDPALMEYAGRDVFKVRIFPIEANGRKKITISYTQLLAADSGLASYIYPLNTEKFSSKPLKNVSVKVDMETQRPLKTIYSPSHNVEIKRQGARQATIGFEASDIRPDQDFQIVYSEESADIGMKLLCFRQNNEDGYFVLLATPGLDDGKKTVIPKDVVFVLDTSGSMVGDKLKQAKKALLFCVENLNEADRFEIVRFSTEAESLFGKLQDNNEGNRQKAASFINNLRAIGGTAIEEALDKALAVRPEKTGRPSVVIFLTDGQPTVGVTSEEEILKAIKKHNETRARVFCFGIGNDVNTHLLDKITDETRAFSQYVLPTEDIEVKVSNFYNKIREPVLTNPTLTFGSGIKAVKMYPSPLPDLFKGEQLVLAGRYSGAGHAAVTLEGTVNGETRRITDEVRFPEKATDHEFIPRLWATRRIGFLLNEVRLRGDNAELRDEITELARQFGIVTPYTAFLITEDEGRRNVPLARQSLRSFAEDHDAKKESSNLRRDFAAAKFGEPALASARSSIHLNQANTVEESLSFANAEAQRNLAASAPAETASRIAQYTQQNRFVNGRAFYQNGSQWVDSKTQAGQFKQRVQVAFASPEYFALAEKRPETRSWLALGRNVQFVLDNTLFEVTD